MKTKIKKKLKVWMGDDNCVSTVTLHMKFVNWLVTVHVMSPGRSESQKFLIKCVSTHTYEIGDKKFALLVTKNAQ